MTELPDRARYVSVEHYDLGPNHERWSQGQYRQCGIDLPFAPLLVVGVPEVSGKGVVETVEWLSDHYASLVRIREGVYADGWAHPLVFEIAPSEFIGERMFWQLVSDLVSVPFELLHGYVMTIIEHTSNINQHVPFAEQAKLVGEEALYGFADRWLYPSPNTMLDATMLRSFTDLFLGWLSLNELDFEVEQDRYVRRLFLLLNRSKDFERLAQLLQVRLFRGQAHNSNATSVLNGTPGIFKMVLDGLIVEELGQESPYAPPYPDLYFTRSAEPGQDWRYEALIEDVYGSDRQAKDEVLDYIESKVGGRPGGAQVQSGSRAIQLISDADHDRHQAAVDQGPKSATGLHEWDTETNRWRRVLPADS